MNPNEKIQRELDMLAQQLHLMRDAYLIRIIKNKRLPLSERYAAHMQYDGCFHLPDDSSDAALKWELDLSIQEIDRKPL
jgi:hypothetical protein